MHCRTLILVFGVMLTALRVGSLSTADEKTNKGKPWKQIEPDVVRRSAKTLIDAYHEAKIAEGLFSLELDPQEAVGCTDGNNDIVIIPLRGFREGNDYPETKSESGLGFGLVFLPSQFQLLVNGKPLSADDTHTLDFEVGGKRKPLSVVLVAARERDTGEWRMLVHGKPSKRLIDGEVGEAPVQRRLPVDLDVTDFENGRTQIKVWAFAENWSAFDVKRPSD